MMTLTLFASCGSAEGLDTPTGAAVEYETLTFRWGAVSGAKIYTVRIEREGEEPTLADVSRTSYSLEGLDSGRYTLSVAAKSNKRGTKSSGFCKGVEFIRDAECGLAYRLINGGTEYEVSGKAGATGNIVIPATYRQKPVTSIGDEAFFGENDIISLTLPETIKNIGNSAFAGCTYLESVNIPNGLLSIGADAFSGCRALGGTVSLPGTLTSVSDGAFAYCSSLSGVSFGEGIEKIGKNAFTDCSHISSLTFPDSLTALGEFAFAACSRIETVEFGDSFVTLGDFAFSKAIALSEITLPESTRVIGNGAFYHCISLATVNIGSGIEAIGHSAFYETPIYEAGESNEIYVGNWFRGLKNANALAVNIKHGTVGIANNALFGNGTLNAVELPDSVRRIGSLAFGSSAIVSVVAGGGVEYISEQAFSGCSRLTTVLLGSFDYNTGEVTPAPLKSIGAYAFMNCVMLDSIDIPESVGDIGAYAFRGSGIYNSALTGVVYAGGWLVDYNENLVDTVEVYPGTVGIANYAFYNCRVLKSIKIPTSVKIIGRGAFYACSELESVSLPDTLARIEDYTFYATSRLKIRSLPPMLKEIGRAAFYMSGTVKDYNTDTDTDTLEMPSSLTYIGDFAFYGCGYRQADNMDGTSETGGIDIILMGDGIEYIGRCAFYGFNSLREVRIGGAAMIGDRAFYQCPSLEKISVGAAVTKIGNEAFYECSRLTEAHFPNTLCEVGEYAFYRCESLDCVTLGTSLGKLGDFAFYGCRELDSIFIPTVKIIGNQTFRACLTLKSLTISSSLEYVGDFAFYGCDGLTLYFEHTAALGEWSEVWNATYCPAVFGCTLSPEGDAVVSVKGGAVQNNFHITTLSSPAKEGYTFLGWSDTEGDTVAKYPTSAITEGEGVLYAVWQEN